MSGTASGPPALVPETETSRSLSLVELGPALAGSPMFARCLIAGLPALGLLSALVFGLPLFGGLMTACFLLGTALVCHQALATFAGQTLRLLVTSRLVLVLVVGAVLCCAGDRAWTAVVSAALLWLVADRLLGQRAQHDLWKRVREPK